MKEIIQTLDERIARLRPEFYANLEPGLNSDQIARLEETYQVKIPADLRELYQWKNGQKEECYEAFVNNSMFLTLEEALDIAAENTSMIGLDFEIENWWHKKWLPLFHNGGGDYICYDFEGIFTGQPGQLIEFWHTDNDRNVIAPDLKSFVRKINEYYESTPPEQMDDYFEIANSAPYPKKFRVE